MVKPTTFDDPRFDKNGRRRQKLSRRKRGKRAYQAAIKKKVDKDLPSLLENVEKVTSPGKKVPFSLPFSFYQAISTRKGFTAPRRTDL